MKKLLSVLLLFVLTGLFAAPPAAQKVTRTYHRHHKHYGKGEYYQISRDNFGYLIYFQWVKATQTKEEKVLIGLPEPNFWSGFNRRGMFDLIIDKISIQDLEPKAVTLLKEPGIAGINALYNFNGVWMDIRFFMDEKSPVLHVECLRNARTKKAVRSIELKMGVYPTIDGQPRNSYKRELITPAHTYQKSGWTKVHKDDTYFVMYDAKYEGSAAKPRSNGPAYLKWDTSILKSGRFYYGSSSSIFFDFKIKPETARIAFDLLELKKKSTNKEFFDFLTANGLMKKAGK